jgi:hypothetical protein
MQGCYYDSQRYDGESAMVSSLDDYLGRMGMPGGGPRAGDPALFSAPVII